MSKWNLERFTGGRRVVELQEGATKGATVGVDLFYNGVLVLWEDIYNGAASGVPSTPGTTITAWSLILDIPQPILDLASLSGTGFVFVTSPTDYSVIDTTSAVAGSVPQFDGLAWGMGTALSNPMTTLGDIITADVGGVPKRLAIGANGEILTVVAGEPAYVAPGFVESVNSGAGITVDNTDPKNPIINATGGGGGVNESTMGATFSLQVLAPKTSIQVNCDGTITSATLLGGVGQIGSIVVDVLKSTYSGYDTVSSICGASKPTISSANKSTDSTLTGWTTSFLAGDCFVFSVDSFSGFSDVTLILGVTKS